MDRPVGSKMASEIGQEEDESDFSDWPSPASMGSFSFSHSGMDEEDDFSCWSSPVSMVGSYSFPCSEQDVEHTKGLDENTYGISVRPSHDPFDGITWSHAYTSTGLGFHVTPHGSLIAKYKEGVNGLVWIDCLAK